MTATVTSEEPDADKLSLSQKAENPIKLTPSFEQQIAAARTLVGQDPKRAAQVVKEWVAADGYRPKSSMGRSAPPFCS